MVLATSSQALWYLTRGTGLVSLVLLTFSVVLGIVETVRWAHPQWPRFLTAGLHRNVSLLVTVFLAAHIVTAIVDSFAPISWIDAVVPFTSSYRPIWLGLGAVASDLIVALTVTSLLRRRIGLRTWRIVHWTAYACWPVALLHGLGTGSDTRVNWGFVLQMGSLAIVVAAVGWRLAVGWRGSDTTVRVIAAIWGAVAVIGIVGFTALGPLQKGWARRAGTPVKLLTSTRAAAASPASPAGPSSPAQPSAPTATPLTVPFSASLTGTLHQAQDNATGDTVVTIDASLAGGATGTLQIVLRGRPLDDGGVAMRSSSVTLGPTDRADAYRGTIVSLAGSRMRASLQDATGHAIDLQLRFRIDEATQGVTGTATASTVG